MKLFDERDLSGEARLELRRAMEQHAEDGGQSLHVWDPDQNPLTRAFVQRAPVVFQRSRPWAHLIDNDLVRLKATARRLGVRVIAVGRQGIRGQHIDLCAGPLKRAMEEANKV